MAKHKDYESPRGLSLARLLGYAAAVLAALVALAGSRIDARTDARPTLFGWERVLVAHILCSLPLCTCLARLAQAIMPARRRTLAAMLWIIVGACAALAASMTLPLIAAALERNEAGFLLRLLVRVGICVGVELPWCLAAESYAARLASHTSAAVARRWFAGRWWRAIALVAAVGPPAAFALDLCRRETARAGELLGQQQLVLGNRVVARLGALGSPYPLSGISAPAATRQLARALAAIERRLHSASSATPAPAQLIERARDLAMLDRPDDACRTIEPLAESRPDAALLLAAILQHHGDWAESTRWYRASLRLLGKEPPSAEATAARVRAYSGLAFNAREGGDFAAAESAYRQGLSEVPQASAQFHFQLGRHYRLGGRPLDAARELRRAADIAPQSYREQAKAMLAQMSLDTPGCVLGAGLTPGSGEVPAPRR